MTTTVVAAAARSIGYDTFTDLLPEGCRVESVRKEGSLLAVTFSSDLDAATVQAIRDRMMSRDDADQADRDKLRAAAAAGATNLAEMHLAYTLGDPIPDAVLPATTTQVSAAKATTTKATATKAAKK